MMSLFEALLGYQPQMSYENNCDPQSKSQTANENAAALHDLIKELKVNLAGSQELYAICHNKHVKERSYRLGESSRVTRATGTMSQQASQEMFISVERICLVEWQIYKDKERSET